MQGTVDVVATEIPDDGRRRELETAVGIADDRRGKRRTAGVQDPDLLAHSDVLPHSRVAAATGFAIMVMLSRPVDRAASSSASRRAARQCTGQVRRTSRGPEPSARLASSMARFTRAPSASVTGTSFPPSSSRPSPTERNGAGSKASGTSAACASASLPTCQAPRGSSQTADGADYLPPGPAGGVLPGW